MPKVMFAVSATEYTFPSSVYALVNPTFRSIYLVCLCTVSGIGVQKMALAY